METKTITARIIENINLPEGARRAVREGGQRYSPDMTYEARESFLDEAADWRCGYDRDGLRQNFIEVTGSPRKRITDEQAYDLTEYDASCDGLDFSGMTPRQAAEAYWEHMRMLEEVELNEAEEEAREEAEEEAREEAEEAAEAEEEAREEAEAEAEAIAQRKAELARDAEYQAALVEAEARSQERPDNDNQGDDSEEQEG